MKKNLLEWSVFAASILLLLGLIGYLAVKSVSYKDTPPDLRVSIAASTDSLQRNIYKLELVNKGAQTAENITICLLYTSPSPRDRQKSRMPSSA